MVDGPAPLAQVGVFKLFDAFQRLLSRTKQKAEHLIDVDRISISERIIELVDLLRGQGRVPFEQIFGGDTTRSELIVSFLAVLEMTRLRMMEVTQDDPRDELLIELTLSEEHDEYLRQSDPSDDPLTALARGEIGELAMGAGMPSATKAVEIDPSDSLGHAYKAWLHCADPRRGPIVDAMTCARRAVDLNPNSAYALRALGFVQVMAGEPQLAIETVKRALRLSPRDPLRGNWYNLLSMACCIAGQYADGIAYGLVATSETPRFAVAHVYLATNYIGLGETDKAKAALAFARRLAPRFVEKFLGDETTGGLMMRRPEDAHRVTTFARVAAGLEDVGAAISLR
jgi:tetratricopeptide (TPR) repeat protein